MPILNGVKFACEPCMRGHRSSKCTHSDRILIKVRKPGRPLSSCPHEAGTCSCEIASVAIPKSSNSCPCGTPDGRVKKEDKGPKVRGVSHLSSIPSTPVQQAPMAPTFGFPGGFLSPGIENPNDFMSGIDPQMWPPGGFNGMNPLDPFAAPLDLGTPQFFPPGPPQPTGLPSVPIVKTPSSKKSCCKPEPGSMDPQSFMDAATAGFPGLQPTQLPPNNQYGDFQIPKEQKTRRHTTEMYPRKRASVGTYPDGDMRQFGPHGPDGRSTSVPNVPLMGAQMVPGMQYGPQQGDPISLDTQDPDYTIYSTRRFNQRQVNYMNAIREAHERQLQEEADNARRASQASEHARKISGGCCAPPDPAMPYALPHGQECGCGPNCSCVMCITHPYNNATVEYIRNIHQTMQTPEQSSEEHSPSAIGFSHSVSGAEFPSTGGVGMFGDTVLDNILDDKDMLSMQGNQLSPSAFIQLDYNLGNCSQHNGGCMCGDGCQCIGCLTHGGHNGVPFHSDPDGSLLTQSLSEHPLEEAQTNAQNDNLSLDEQKINDNSDGSIWKTEDSSSSSGIRQANRKTTGS
ncbi:hypothetical protein TWF569_009278 [Orbilia oligospora]|uniref:Copper-fist domain-containing protein n=1 Tax=Orbilia oligospora TaxID=2813651 RepID=A0A7C8JTS8_ORBOL|nr:hypothetical protein TWF569_009278 [Orbilia oligospora]KAF3141255.1 hypothetical protein TWF703_002050 [Orbilia oligospora]